MFDDTVGEPVLILEHSQPVVDDAGRMYVAASYGQARLDGTWIGWLEFTPSAGGPVLRTGRETTQPSREMTAYWATGLEPVYLDGALRRAS